MHAGVCGSYDLNTRFWNGDSWDTVAQHAEHDASTGNTITGRGFDIGWHNFSGTQGVLLAWRNSSNGFGRAMGYKNWTVATSTWSAATYVYPGGNWTEQYVIQLTWDEKQKEMWSLVGDSQNDINFIQYNGGTSWSGFTELAGPGLASQSCALYKECFYAVPSTDWHQHVPPNITLIFPLNNSQQISLSINFTFETIQEEDITNCTLWTNESDWSIKAINESPVINNTVFGINISFTGDSDYIWNIQCYDTLGFMNFSTYNYTVLIDSIKPIFSNNFTEGTLKRYTNFTANITVSDNRLINYAWFSTNNSGQWQNDSKILVNSDLFSINATRNITFARGNYICWGV
jgi:hypothetical protein